MKVLLLLLVVLVTAQTQNESKLVYIAQGPVRGYKVPNFDVFAFHGIPYATAPTGNDRFKAPLPPPNWTEPFEAADSFVVCHQEGVLGNFGKEDCLVANVFTPDTNDTNLPVMFLVHGGGFQTGYSNIGPTEGFVQERRDVIVVTFNYRLGPLGFLCLGTPDIPGNAGMKDQVAALRWVNANIAAFGGNPNDVTIAGCSAGGAAVDLLMLSRTTDGLYNKMIGQSGAAIGAFAAQINPTANARYYAERLNYDGPDDINALEEFYKNVTYEELFSISLDSPKDVAVLMAPCVERDLGGEAFLDDTPTNIIRSGNFIRVPMLYGWANMEGLLREQLFDTWKVEMSEDFAPFLPADLQFESVEERNEVAQRVKEFYFGEGPIRDDQIISYINFHTDVMFVYAMQREVTLLVEAGNNEIYLSVYSYVRNNTRPIPHTDENGADHCFQTFAVLYEDLNTAPVQALREVWLDFIHTGKPTPNESQLTAVPRWDSARNDRTPCMDFDNTIQVLPEAWARERQEFWDDIYDRYHREPSRPDEPNGAFSASAFSLNSVLIFSIMLKAIIV